MNLNIKLMFLATLLPLCLVFTGVTYGQKNKGYKISGLITGLKDGTEITLKSLGGKGNKTTTASGGRFSFEGMVELEGTPYELAIAGQEKVKQLLLDNDLELTMSGKLDNWPDCEEKSSNYKGSYLDFQLHVQAPFSDAYLSYFNTMKVLTGKNSVTEWETAIKQSRGTDSLRMVLPREVYQTATQTYIKEVFLRIGLYPDSYFTPSLIMFWWPQGRKERTDAYNRLDQKVKDSYYGRQLAEEIKLLE